MRLAALVLLALSALSPDPTAALSLVVTGGSADPAGTVACEVPATDCLAEAVFFLDSAQLAASGSFDTASTSGSLTLGTLTWTNPTAGPGDWATVSFPDYRLDFFMSLLTTGSPTGALQVFADPTALAGAAFNSRLAVLDAQGSILQDTGLPLMQIGIFENLACTLVAGVGQCSFDLVGPTLTQFGPPLNTSYQFQQRIVLDVVLPEPSMVVLVSALVLPVLWRNRGRRA